MEPSPREPTPATTSPTSVPIPAIPSHLAHLAISRRDYLQLNQGIDDLVVSALILTPPPAPPNGTGSSISTSTTASLTSAPPPQPKILLIRRAPTDSFPLCWEPPGGGYDAADATILDAVARETLEETGLRISRFVKAISPFRVFQTGLPAQRKTWRSLAVLVEAEGVGPPDPPPPPPSPAAASQDAGVPVSKAAMVQLDAQEHCDFAWFSEEDVLRGWCRGEEMRWMGEREEGRDEVLRAFGVWKEVHGWAQGVA